MDTRRSIVMSEPPDLEPLPFNCPFCAMRLLGVWTRLDEGECILYLCVDHGWFALDDEGRLQRDHRLSPLSIA